ncbi:hypothetical protein BDV19DRAFT_395158 [Aspergillus venezuelensis]
MSLRLLLGFVEPGMVPALEMAMGMFFVPHELHALQPIFWIKARVAPWKLFMITEGGITLLFAILCWTWYPDNPAKARFLTPQECLHVIQRIHTATRGSIEQKTFKKSQFLEALRDLIS